MKRQAMREYIERMLTKSDWLTLKLVKMFNAHPQWVRAPIMHELANALTVSYLIIRSRGK